MMLRLPTILPRSGGRVGVVSAESTQRLAEDLQMTLGRRADDDLELELELGLPLGELVDEPRRLGRIPEMGARLRPHRCSARSRKRTP